jgi:hypothetical protein
VQVYVQHGRRKSGSRGAEEELCVSMEGKRLIARGARRLVYVEMAGMAILQGSHRECCYVCERGRLLRLFTFVLLSCPSTFFYCLLTEWVD